MLSKYTRIANWLRESNTNESHDALISRCNVAAGAINDLEFQLKMSEDRIKILEEKLKEKNKITFFERIWKN